MSAQQLLIAHPRDRGDAPLLDPNVRQLLDHIAVQLAEEYVRLMEAAAGAEVTDGQDAS